MAEEGLARLILLCSMHTPTQHDLMPYYGLHARRRLPCVKALPTWQWLLIFLGLTEMVSDTLAIRSCYTDLPIGHHEENQLAVQDWLKTTGKAPNNASKTTV
jgi:hypothetical protein